jgi:hypothetical protein
MGSRYPKIRDIEGKIFHKQVLGTGNSYSISDVIVQDTEVQQYIRELQVTLYCTYDVEVLVMW